MRIIGPILLDRDNIGLAAAAATLGGTLLLPQAVWRRFTRMKPRCGDLMWVREPFVQYLDRKRGDDSLQYGTITTTKKLASYARLRPSDYMVKPSDGTTMKQRHSRMTLEVAELHPGGVIAFKVHSENVSALYLRRTA